MIDVAVVGAGPAGLHAAKELAQSGLDVRVFEEHATVGAPAHCTGIVSLEVTEFAKLPDELILNHLTRAKVHGPGGATCDMPWSPAAADEIVVIDRAGFDQSLADAATRGGAKLVTSTPVLGITVEPHAVRLDLADRTVRARTCVVASGVSYRFHRQLGLRLPGQMLHTAQVDVDAAPLEHVELHVGRNVAPEGFAWAVPIWPAGQPRLKVGVLARGPAELWLQRFLGRPVIRQRLASLPTAPITRLLPVRPVPRSYFDRVLLVGDAGGFTKPTTGGGIFYSLLTATLAAHTLIDAFRANRFDPGMVADYERRWHDRIGRDLCVGDWFRQVMAKCDDETLDRLVQAMGAGDTQDAIRETARFNWHRGVIAALLHQPRVIGILFRSLFR